ncbi:MAG: phage major capsid protein [Thiotrichales bacterium]|nr:phage major capsid protein [Thiotrichales bacterium]
MTNAQKLAIRLSEIRQRLNEIAGLDDDGMTDEVRSEADKLTTEYRAKETQHRAAIVAEGEEQRAAEGEFGNGDGEPAEVRALLDRVTLGDYLNPATAGMRLAGAPAELNEALEVRIPPLYNGGILLPWRVLQTPEHRTAPTPRGEHRAFTTTGALDGSIVQRPILQRLFGPGILDALGVRVDSVPAGRSEWPLITAGVAPVHKAEGTAADAAVEATFQTEVLKPKRLTGKYEFTHEGAAQVPDLEAGLRRDLADAIKSKMSDQIVNGDEATNAHEVDGFATTIAAPDDAAETAVYATYAGSHAQGVDGIHASMETEVSSVIGVDVYRHAASVYDEGSGEAGVEALRRRSMSCMASPYVGTAANSGQHKLCLYHAAGPNGGGIMRGDSVAAMWPTLEVVRDQFSQASQGVVLTWVSLWDAQTAFRAAAYKRLAFDIT